MKIAVQLEAVRKIYRPRNHPATTAIDDVSLEVPAGQFLGILGAPGAGKTTLLKLVGGRLTPTTGHVRILGLDTAGQRDAATGHVALVQAGALNVSWHRNARETLLADAHCRRLDRTTSDRQIRALLSDLELSAEPEAPHGYVRPATWVRLAIAAALLADPPILALDEPTLDLDESEAESLLAVLGHLAREHGTTVLLASRHVDAVREHCDRVVLLHRGRLVLDRPSLDVTGVNGNGHYQITVKGQLDGEWSEWFDGLQVSPTSTGETVLSGPIQDQSALHGVLVKVRDLGLPLLSVTRAEPELEDVLGQLEANGVSGDGNKVSGVGCQVSGEHSRPNPLPPGEGTGRSPDTRYPIPETRHLIPDTPPGGLG
jgi:ABC-2 type transport system ATP-binding protein